VGVYWIKLAQYGVQYRDLVIMAKNFRVQFSKFRTSSLAGVCAYVCANLLSIVYIVSSFGHTDANSYVQICRHSRELLETARMHSAVCAQDLLLPVTKAVPGLM
jgi:hypothetical protein